MRPLTPFVFRDDHVQPLRLSTSSSPSNISSWLGVGDLDSLRQRRADDWHLRATYQPAADAHLLYVEQRRTADRRGQIVSVRSKLAGLMRGPEHVRVKQPARRVA